jgi:hypothetical protein
VSAATVSTTSATVSTATVSAATVSAATGAFLSQETKETDAVRAIAATAAKTNFFIILFFTFKFVKQLICFQNRCKVTHFLRYVVLGNLFFLHFY